MKLITEIQLPYILKSNKISYDSQIGLLGSCFSDNIGKKFNYFKFRSSVNPFGVLFNPKAIEGLIKRATHLNLIEDKDLVFQNERYHCFEAHSDFSHVKKNEVIKTLNSRIVAFRSELMSCSHLIITLGTAWCYKYISSGLFVANCHKVPQSKFNKEVLSVSSIQQSLEQMISLVTALNPNIKIILTVSPVRHLKDGAVQNTQSKSHLISAVHEIVKLNNVFYFPSYEIMMDELRGYRFYKSDLIHPNQFAIDYIWDKFKSVWINDNAFSTMKEVEFVQKGLQHKPFNPDSDAHKVFLSKICKQIDDLKRRYSFMSF